MNMTLHICPEQAEGEADDPDSSDSPDPEPPDAEVALSRSDAAAITVDVEPVGCDDVDGTRLADLLMKAIARLDATAQRVSVRVIDDATMARLHETYAGTPGTTDVLTFPASGPGESIDVDIAVCVDEARRQAAPRAHAVEAELLLYAVHGLLHVAGFDDHDPDASHAMHAEEDRLLDAIGVGAVYGRPARDADAADRDGGLTQ